MNFKGWGLKKLRDWLRQPSIQENDIYDWKEMIPDDEAGKHRLKKECCGFANQKGGFLLFGVDKNKRIVGVEKDDEFLKRLNQIITTHVTPATIKCELHEYIDLKSGGRCVYIIRIHASREKPHVFYKEEKKGLGLSIPLRKNGFLDYLTRGDDIRRLCLDQDAYYPEYGIHVIEILKKIKGQFEPSFTLWETTICYGFKNYLQRPEGTDSDKALASVLMDIEERVGNLKRSISNIFASTEGGEPKGVQDREQLGQAIDSFIDKYRMMFI